MTGVTPYTKDSWKKTNYDRIISKTPEELAVLISENIDCGVCENVFGLQPCGEKCCPDFWLYWLQQDAEGE